MRVAGRLAAKRGQGKAIFADLVDRSGRIQLLGRLNVLGEEAFERLRHADLGDIVGADGTIIRSRAGELTISVDDVTLLAKSLRPPPEKHHGLTDTETRFRKRELDLMANEESREVFIARARIITEIRRFLDEHGFVEVETPMLQTLYGGAAARPFVTHHNALDRDMYLRIATELYLKRLIVGGLERVYEIGKNFRNEGLSPKHNPEFTVLEWYEAYADYDDIAARCEQLIHRVASALGQGERFAPPWHRETLAGAIESRSGVDILANRDLASLQAAMRAAGHEVPEHEETWARLVDFLLSKYVEPTLQEPTFLLDYPVELSPLAKRHRAQGGPRRALGGVRGRDGDRQRVHRAQRPRRPARPLRGAEARRRRGRRGGPALRRGVRRGARAGHAADRRHRDRHRPPGDAAHGPDHDPRGRAVPGHARGLSGPALRAPTGRDGGGCGVAQPVAPAARIRLRIALDCMKTVVRPPASRSRGRCVAGTACMEAATTAATKILRIPLPLSERSLAGEDPRTRAS